MLALMSGLDQSSGPAAAPTERRRPVGPTLHGGLCGAHSCSLAFIRGFSLLGDGQRRQPAGLAEP